MDGAPQNKGKKYGYNEKDRRLKEHFINCIHDDMMTQIIMELITIKKTNKVISEQAWA